MSISCIPLPGQWQPAETFDQPVASDIHWQSAVCARTHAWLERLSASAAMGPVTVHIDDVVTDSPHLHMDESYTLERVDGVTHLHAATTWGGLCGASTLYQLAAAGQLGRGLNVVDKPRFAWRGVLIDVARHFIPLPVLHRVLHGMALLHMNVLHLHLSDDQGFRFPSAHFPRLASAEHYTQAELSQLVALAADLGIRVVPELDMPGHVTSWLVAYPEWGSQPTDPSTRFGVHKACLNPADEAVYAAVDMLLDELNTVFPDAYVHVGGDEVHPAWWREDAHIQAFMSARQLAEPADLQNYFLTRVIDMVTRRGRKVLAWDEVLHDELGDVTVQNWRGATTRDRALAQGRPVLVSAPYYLDLHFSAATHYRFDPAAEQSVLLVAENAVENEPQHAHVAAGMAWTHQWRQGQVDTAPAADGVLGGEACLWSELVDGATLETRLWSRLPAVAERLWSPASACEDVDNMYTRLQSFLDLPDIDSAAVQRRALTALHLDSNQVEIALLLEPVKWYGRLLGEQALAARIGGSEMPQARPYDVHTPFDRVIDMIAPESLSARRLATSDVEAWRHQARLWQAQDLAAWPADVQAAVAALQKVAALVLENFAHDPAQLWALYGPHGDYVLAVVPALLDAQQSVWPRD